MQTVTPEEDVLHRQVKAGLGSSLDEDGRIFDEWNQSVKGPSFPCMSAQREELQHPRNNETPLSFSFLDTPCSCHPRPSLDPTCAHTHTVPAALPWLFGSTVTTANHKLRLILRSPMGKQVFHKQLPHCFRSGWKWCRSALFIEPQRVCCLRASMTIYAFLFWIIVLFIF